MEAKRSDIMAPMDALEKTDVKLIEHAGITIDSRLQFGDAANAVTSDLLQLARSKMLSFICYNAFYRRSIIY